jgi:spore germination protein
MGGTRWNAMVVVCLAVVAFLGPATACTGEGDGGHVAAYLVPWDRDGGLASIDAAAGRLTEVSPWAYTLDETGGIGFTAGGQDIVDDDTLAALRGRGLKVTPSIANLPASGVWDDVRVRAVIADPERTQAHIAAIAAVVRDHGYDGIDIDYENLGQQPGDRANFTRFISGLADALHADGRTLSVAVYGKGDDAGYTPAAQAQDYAALGAAADQLRLMLYDFDTRTPGPVAPRWWVDQVLAYATSQIAPARVVQGIGLYGYGWPPPDDPADGDDPDVPDGPEQFTWADAVRRAAEQGVPIEWDDTAQAPHFTYPDRGVTHDVWFENARSTADKLTLGRAHGAGGVMFWRLGGEDPATWTGPTAPPGTIAQPGARR